MPIDIEWDNEAKTLIRWNFIGHWTAQEFRDIIEKSNEMITAQDHVVNHIIDFSRAESIPPKSIGEVRYGMGQMPKNLGHVVVITQGGFIEALGEALRRFSWFNRKIHVVHTDAEAHAYIETL